MKKIEKNLIALMNYLKDYIQENNYSPSFREIADAIRVTSISTVKYYLHKLEKINKIKLHPNKNRAIEITDNYTCQNSKSIPSVLFSDVPIVSKCNYNDVITENCEVVTLPKNFFGDKLFIIKNKTDALTNISICDGDLLIVRKQEAGNNGDLLVLNVNNSIIIRKYYKDEKCIKLIAENDVFKPQYYENEQVIVLGKVVKIIRNI